MKILLAIVLTLFLLQRAACTHLETCDCHEIRALVNETVRESISRLDSKFDGNRALVNETVKVAISRLESKFDKIIALVNETVEKAIFRLESKFSVPTSNQSELIATFEKLLQPIQKQLNYHLPPPPQPNEVFTESKPAKSCKAIYDEYSYAESGYYWIKNSSGSAVRVYCKMDANCTGYSGGWMRVAYIDMRNWT